MKINEVPKKCPPLG